MIFLFSLVFGAWNLDVLVCIVLVIIFAYKIGFLILNRRWREFEVYYIVVQIVYQFEEQDELGTCLITCRSLGFKV